MAQTVTIPRWLYEAMHTDSNLVRHLGKYHGNGWVQAVREEMELEQKYTLGVRSERYERD